MGKTKTSPATSEQTAEDSYRQAVIAAESGTGPAEPTRQLLETAGRLPGEFARHMARMKNRRDAVANVASADRMDCDAKLLESAPPNPRTQPLSAFQNTSEVIDADVEFRAHSAPNVMTPRKFKAHQLRMDARQLRIGAMQTLVSTADPTICEAIDGCSTEIRLLQERITSRARLTNLDRSIAQKTAVVEGLLDGKRPSELSREDNNLSDEELFHRSKAELNDLIAMRPAAEKAVSCNVEDQRKVADLQDKLQKLEADRLLPENIDWS